MLVPEQLDNQSFDEIIQQAQKQISLLTSDWTNYNPSDPGITLLELFSWYKEVQQYHLNALSREHELAYLKLLGAAPHDMKPATALLALTGEGMVEEKSIFLAEDIPFETTRSLAVCPSQVMFLGRNDAVITDFQKVQRAGGNLKFPPFLPEAPGAFCSFTLFFDNPLPAGVPLQLWFQLEDTENTWGEDQTFLPYVTFRGEYWDGEGYCPILVLEDHTQSFFHSGILRFQLPQQAQARFREQGYPLRFVLEKGEYVKPPIINDIRFNAVQVVQRETFSQVQSYRPSAAGVIELAQDALSQTQRMEVYGVEGDRWIPLSWESIRPRRVRLSASGFETVQVVTWKKEADDLRRLGFANGIACFQIPLLQSDLLPNSLTLLVKEPDGNWYYWERVDDFYSAGPSSRQYCLDTDSNTLRFGDGEQGRAPEGELLLLSWSTSLGELGNIQEGYLLPPSQAQVQEAACVSPAQGGSSPETTEACFRRVKQEFHQPKRCVTLRDFEQIALSTPGTYLKRVQAFVKDEAPNQVFLAIETQGNNITLHPGVVENLKHAILPKVMINTKVNFLAPVYVRLKIYAQIRVKLQFFTQQEEIRRSLADYFEDSAIGFGSTLSKNALLDYLYAMPQVDRVEILELSFSGNHAVLRGGDIILGEGCLPKLDRLNLTIQTDEN